MDFSWPPKGSGGVSTYANLAAFPSAVTSGNGALAIALDTNILYESNGSAWIVLATPGGGISLGAFGSSPNSSGASLSGGVLTLQPADGTHPGGLSITTQTIAGEKTLTSNLNISTTRYTNTGLLLLTNDGVRYSGTGAVLVSAADATGLATLTANNTAGFKFDVTSSDGLTSQSNARFGSTAGAFSLTNPVAANPSLNIIGAASQTSVQFQIQDTSTNKLMMMKPISAGDQSLRFGLTSAPTITYAPTKRFEIETVRYVDSDALAMKTSDGAYNVGTGSIIMNPAFSTGLSGLIFYNDAGTMIDIYNAAGSTLFGRIKGVSAGASLVDASANNQITWNTSGVALPQLTASTVPYLSASKIITSSAVTPTELGYLSGVTSSIQTQLNSKTGGASNLTTVGAVPYVSASGVLNQDASNFFWDSSNHRLGIGVTTPSAPFDVHISASNNAIQANNVGSQGSTAGAIIAVGSDPGAAILSGSKLGQYTFFGTFDTSHTLSNSLSLQGFATENWSSTAKGSKLGLYVTPNTTSGLQLAATLDQDKSLTVVGNVSAPQLISTVSTGTAPLTVSSTTQVANLNAATAGTATNLAGGSGGTIPYQSAAGTTAMLANGTSGQALLSNGGTSAPSWGNVLTNPMTTLGDIIYENATPAPARLAGNTTSTINFLGQTGTGSVSAAPAWTAFTAPTIQTFTSGSGTYTLPTSPRKPLYIRVRMVGGGGGGGGSSLGAGTAGTGGTGGNTTFGTTLLVANGGTGGAEPRTGGSGTGGTASLGTGPIGTAIQGGSGETGGFNNSASAPALASGIGASSPFGGAGGGTTGSTTTGLAAIANTGSGGGGAGTVQNNPSSSGHGGGAGGYVDALISNPSSTYSYAVGSSGTGGTAGTSGAAGGAGGSGYIEVTEYYQ